MRFSASMNCHAYFKDDRARRLKDLIRDFHLLDAKLLRDIGPDGRLGIVEAWQAVHEDSIRSGLLHDGGIDLIRRKQADALCPQLGGLSHRDPDVGVEHVGIARALVHGVGEHDLAARLRGNRAALLDELCLGHVLLRAARAEAHAHLCTHHHERVRHVVARITKEGELEAAQVAELLAHGEHVGNHLCGMELGSQAIPHGDAGVRRKLLHDCLVEAAILDAIVHAAEHAGGVLDGLFVAHLRARGIEIRHAHAQVVARDLERAARTRGGLLKEEHDVLALEMPMRHTSALELLEVCREVDEILNLGRSEVEQLEKVAATEINAHESILSFVRQHCILLQASTLKVHILPHRFYAYPLSTGISHINVFLPLQNVHYGRRKHLDGHCPPHSRLLFARQLTCKSVSSLPRQQ